MRFGKSLLAASLLSIPLASGETCKPAEEETILDFTGSSVSTSTLEDAFGELRFDNVGSYRQGNAITPVDLVITRTPDTVYDYNNLEKNRKNGYYGSINVLSQNGQGTFDFCFEESATGTPIELDHFYFSFYDLDAFTDTKGYEQITMRKEDYTEYYVTDTTQLKVIEDNANILTLEATKGGSGDDNPDDPNDLSDLQKDRGVVFLMNGGGCFRVKLSVNCENKNCNGGRNFLFAGRAKQLIPQCPTLAPTSSPTLTPTPAPTSGSVIGDPHIKTWTGERYDYHGVCDLVMVQNPDFKSGLGMDIHVRTKRMRRWSYISNAVLRIGEETLEIMGGSEDKYWINGVEGGELSTLSGFAITHDAVNAQKREFRVELSGEEYVLLKTFKDMVMVSVENASASSFQGSLGLLGSFGKGEKKARDNLTIIEDYNEFGQEWQVRPDEAKLFHTIEGPQAPQKCQLPSTQALRRRLGESKLTLDDAKTACSRVRPEDFDVCVFDVLATDDSELAGAY